jgi:hypothetical protein
VGKFADTFFEGDRDNKLEFLHFSLPLCDANVLSLLPAASTTAHDGSIKIGNFMDFRVIELN